MEIVRLTASFKLDGPTDRLDPLFSTYKALVQELLDYAVERNVTSFKRLKAEKYHELRDRHPSFPSHYLYTACQVATSIYRSFRRLKRRGRVKDRPEFRGTAVMLDDHLFKLDLDEWEVSLATSRGRVRFKLLHGGYHEKFRFARVGQAWVVRRGVDYYLKVVFRFKVELSRSDSRVLGVDINENNVTVAWVDGSSRGAPVSPSQAGRSGTWPGGRISSL